MKILICDDEIDIIEQCKNRVKDIAKEVSKPIEIITYGNGEWMLKDSEEWLSSVSLMYLDIEIHNVNGIDLAKKVREMGYIGDIVFLTISKAYVFDSFEVEPLNYILKNELNDEKFKSVLVKALINDERKNGKNFICKHGKSQIIIPISEIRFFEVNKKIVTLHYKSQSQTSFYSNMDEVLERLLDEPFIRIHRSYIVNMNEIHQFSTKEIKIKSGEVLPVGRKYRDETKEKFTLYLEEQSFII